MRLITSDRNKISVIVMASYTSVCLVILNYLYLMSNAVVGLACVSRVSLNGLVSHGPGARLDGLWFGMAVSSCPVYW